MPDIPIFVEDEPPVSGEEMRATAERILEGSESGDATLLAQLVLRWLDWKPEGWNTPEAGR